MFGIRGITYLAWEHS